MIDIFSPLRPSLTAEKRCAPILAPQKNEPEDALFHRRKLPLEEACCSYDLHSTAWDARVYVFRV